MKSALPVVLLALVASSAQAAPESYTADPNHTWPGFEINHFGFSIQRGRFEKTAGKIVLDTAEKKGSIEITIEARSLSMGFEKWTKHIQSEDFFDVEKYPTLTYKSDKLLFDGDKLVGAEGELTLHGVSKPVKLTVSNFKCGPNPFNKKPQCGAEISAQIKRSDFGMSKFLPAVGDDVKIFSPIEAYRD
ncbi:MAG: polyisoprenoid-binding protein [Rhodocyclaceae bacterium]|nr:polyisoprenoid-binding protein [Rhodocyclaceae bacterium]MBX3670001.1 polyisoprenoid-binding protein [Rhodocyclaceae bacterium]